MSVSPAQKRRKPAAVPEKSTAMRLPTAARSNRRAASRVSGNTVLEPSMCRSASANVTGGAS